MKRKRRGRAVVVGGGVESFSYSVLMPRLLRCLLRRRACLHGGVQRGSREPPSLHSRVERRRRMERLLSSSSSPPPR